MPAAGKRKQTRRNVIADATDRLLRAAKQKMLKEKGHIDYQQLKREGFNPQMIARLKAL
jgi:hypothetical protein